MLPTCLLACTALLKNDLKYDIPPAIAYISPVCGFIDTTAPSKSGFCSIIYTPVEILSFNTGETYIISSIAKTSKNDFALAFLAFVIQLLSLKLMVPSEPSLNLIFKVFFSASVITAF